MKPRSAFAWVPVKSLVAYRIATRLDPFLRRHLVQVIGDVFRPDGGNRVRHQRDVGIVLGEERAAGARHVEQEHLVFLRDRHRDRGQHRAGIRDQQVHVVLGDELVVQRGGRRGAALVVVGDQLDRDLLVVGLHVHPALGVHEIDPELQRIEHRHGDAGERAGAGIERTDLDRGRCGRRLCGAAQQRGQQPQRRQQSLELHGQSSPVGS